MTLCGCSSALPASARPSHESVSLRSVKMSEEAQIPAQRSGFAFLGHTPPPVSTLTYLLSVWVPARGQECACVYVFVHVCVCICVHMHMVECVCFSCKLMCQNEMCYIPLHIVKHTYRNLSKQTKEWAVFFLLPPSLSLYHVWYGGGTHRCREELAPQIKPSTHYSTHAIHNQLRGQMGVQKSKKKKKKQGSF